MRYQSSYEHRSTPKLAEVAGVKRDLPGDAGNSKGGLTGLDGKILLALMSMQFPS